MTYPKASQVFFELDRAWDEVAGLRDAGTTD